MINRIATDGVMPDLTILLDCPPEHGLRRVRSSQMQLAFFDTDEPLEGRIDPEGDQALRAGARGVPQARARRISEDGRREPDRWRVIDATRPADEVADEVWRHVSARLAEPGAEAPTADELEWTARA